MKKKRVIPVLLLKNGQLVQSKAFSRHKNLGNPFMAVKRLSEWAADEIIYLDISGTGEIETQRADLAYESRSGFLDIVSDVARVTRMPVTFGGGIRTLRDIEDRLKRGADKVSINTQVLADPGFVTAAAKEFGAQCVVVCMDVRFIDGVPRVMGDRARIATAHTPVEWARIVESAGAGEILLQAADRDGAGGGYDLDLIDSIASAVRVPVIALGGAGEWSHMGDVLAMTRADAVAAANIFQYYDQSFYLAKKHIFDRGLPVRPPDLLLVD